MRCLWTYCVFLCRGIKTRIFFLNYTEKRTAKDQIYTWLLEKIDFTFIQIEKLNFLFNCQSLFLFYIINNLQYNMLIQFKHLKVFVFLCMFCSIDFNQIHLKYNKILFIYFISKFSELIFVIRNSWWLWWHIIIIIIIHN